MPVTKRASGIAVHWKAYPHRHSVDEVEPADDYHISAIRDTVKKCPSSTVVVLVRLSGFEALRVVKRQHGGATWNQAMACFFP